MKHWTLRRVVPALPIVAVALAFTSTAALAQNYPSQTVRIIVPQAAGGLNDISARLIQPHLERALKQPVIIDNKPGAAGVIGTDAVAKAAPDGQTLLMVAGSLTVLAATNPKLPYDTERDLVPIAQLFGYPFVFVISSPGPFVRSRSAGLLATNNTLTCPPSPSRAFRASRRCPGSACSPRAARRAPSSSG